MFRSNTVRQTPPSLTDEFLSGRRALHDKIKRKSRAMMSRFGAAFSIQAQDAQLWQDWCVGHCQTQPCNSDSPVHMMEGFSSEEEGHDVLYEWCTGMRVSA